MSNRPIPWHREKLERHRLMALAEMTPEEHAARDEAIARAAERKKAAKIVRRNRVQTMFDLVLQGCSSAEIAFEIGVSPQRLSEIRRSLGFAFASRNGHRRIAVWVKDDHVRVADEIAEANMMARDAVLSEILAAALSDAGHVARRITGLKKAKVAA